jgi:hypothetical protein
MPDASREALDAARKLFGDTLSDTRCLNYLEGCGYKMTESFGFERPEGVDVTDDVRAVVRYLQEEWDYGGIVDADPPDDTFP